VFFNDDLTTNKDILRAGIGNTSLTNGNSPAPVGANSN
jgi:hypothetical protein